jgi:hypothetical protein
VLTKFIQHNVNWISEEEFAASNPDFLLWVPGPQNLTTRSANNTDNQEFATLPSFIAIYNRT